MALKNSKQREAIRQFLMTRKDHPTADVVYTNIRQDYPNISLGTVYRNLQLLSELGEIAKIQVGDGLDHFDGNALPHNHFICRECGRVIDLEMESIDGITKKAAQTFDGLIEGHITYFYGLCANCLVIDKTSSKEKPLNS